MAEDANAQIRIDIDTTSALASIKNLQRQISVFHQQMQASGNAANAALSQNLQKNLINSINATKAFSANLTNIKSTTESFTNSLEKNKFSMGEYFRYAGASTKTFGRLFRSEFDTINKVARERVKTLQTQYIKMGRDANGALTAIRVRPLSLDMQNLGTQTAMAAQKQQIFNQLIKQGSTNLLNWGKNTQWAGRQLMVGFTIPLAMMGTVAAKSFMDLEKQAIRFKRVYGEIFTTAEDTNKALQDIRSLANEFTKYGVAVEKTMELAADAAAMGKMGADLTAQVAEATRLAVLGGVEQQEALKTTISLTSAFGVAAEDLAKKTDFLNAVENQTVVSIEDLTIAIPKAGPVVRQLGGDVEDLTFFLTAMKEGGINASEGANALKSGLASLINPAQKTKDMLQGLGINIDSIVEGNAGNIKDTVIGFANALDTLDPLNRARAIEQLFGKFQFSRISTLFQNVVGEGTQASRVLELSKATAEELAVLSERELKRVEDSPLFKFQKAVEDMQVSLAPLGEQFIKLVTPLIDFGTRLLKQFNNMGEGGKAFVTGLVAVLGLIAPAALMTIGLVANGVANLIKGFNSVRLFYQRLSGSSTELGNTTQYMTQEQLEAAAVAASLGQTHSQLAQIFTSEAQAIQGLITAYRQATVAANALNSVAAVARVRPPTVVTTNSMGGKRAVSPAGPPGFAKGILSVPGPKGAGDIVAAMLSPGEAVIPAEQTEKYGALISGIVSDSIPGYKEANVKKSPQKLDLDDLSSLTPDELSAIAAFNSPDVKRRRTRSAAASSTMIASVGGAQTSPEDLQRLLARVGTGPIDSLKILSNAAEIAVTNGAEAYEEYIDTIKKTYEVADKKVKGTVKSSEQFRKQVKANANFVSKNDPGDATNLMHVGEGESLSGKEAAELNKQGKLNVSPADLKKIIENPDAKIDIKSLFGADNFDNILNKRLAGAGISAEELSGGLRNAGPEKWNKSIGLVGGSVEDLTEEISIFDNAVQNVTDSLPKTTVVFDSQIKAEEARAKKIAAISTQEINSEAVRRVKGQIPNLLPLIEKAASTPGEIRSIPIGIEADSNRRDISNGLGNTQLAERAKQEFNRAFPIEEIQKLSQASSIASQEVKDQSVANSNLSTTADTATQNSKQLTSSVNNLGAEVVDTARQIQNATATISSAGNQLSRRAVSPAGPPRVAPRVFANKGLFSVPGPKGAGDVVPAMLSPGEAVIPAKMAQRYAPFIQDMISGSIPGFRSGVFLGMPKSSKAVSKNRTAADQVYELFKKSSYTNTPPTAYGHQISPSVGRSFPIFGLGGVYQKGTKQVFVKPVMDEKAAMAEMRATTIARQAHGLKAPEQRIVVIRDPMDVKRQRRFLALESDLDPTFVNNQPMGVFNEEQYFRQLTASLLRADKDLSGSNVFGNVLADVGPAGVFDRASGLRDYSKNLPSMEEQALINLLGIKGGAKRAFAESTLGLMGSLSPQQYKQKMLAEIQKVLPKLKQTIASFNLQNPLDVGMYDDMIRRLEAGLAVDWGKFHTLHSGVKIAVPKKPKTVEPTGFARGVVSVPGPKGKGDIVPAMLSPGEAVIPTKMARKYAPLISSMISDNIPGYFDGYNPNDDPFRQPSFDSNPFGGEPPEIPVVPDKKAFKDVVKDLSSGVVGAVASGGKKAVQITREVKDWYNADQFSGEPTALDKRFENSKIAAGLTRFISPDAKPADMKSFLGKAFKSLVVRGEKKQEKQFAKSSADAQSQQKVTAGAFPQAAPGVSPSPAGSVSSDILVDEHGNPVVDYNGNTVNKNEAEKEAKAAAKKQARMQRSGQIAGMLGTATMAAGFASQIEGPIGKAAQEALPLLAGASAIVPILTSLPGHLGIIAAGALAVGGALYMLDKNLKDSINTSFEFQKSIGVGQKAMERFAKFAGKASASEIMDKKRESSRRLYQIQGGKTTFGESFVESEDGKQTLNSVKSSISKLGLKDAQTALVQQMQSAVISGSLSAKQARSVVQSIGEELGDYQFSIGVNSQLLNLLGPNGENLLKDPLKIFIDAAISTRSAVSAAALPLLDPNAGKRGFEESLSDYGDLVTEKDKEVDPNMIGSELVGAWNMLTSVGDNALIPGKELGEDVGLYLARTTDALEQYSSIIDAIDIKYEKLIQQAQEAGDIKEVDRLIDEQISAKEKFLKENVKLVDDIVKTFNSFSSNKQVQDALYAGIDERLKKKFESGSDEDILLKGALKDLEKLDIDKGQKYMLKVLVDADQFSESTLSYLTSTFKNKPEGIDQVINMVGRFGGKQTNDIIQIAQGFTTNGKIDAQKQTRFFLKLQGQTDKEANRTIDFYRELQKMGEVLDVEASFDFFMNNPEKATAIMTLVEQLRRTKDKSIKFKVIQSVVGEQAFQRFKANQQYFDKLPKEQQILYVQTVMTLSAQMGTSEFDEKYQNWLKATGLPEGALGPPSMPNAGKSEEDFITYEAERLTKIMEAFAKIGKTTPTGGGGSGSSEKWFETLLRKLKNLRDASINAAGGMKELKRVLGGMKTIKIFDGLGQKLSVAGISESFADELMDMSKKARKEFVTIGKDGKAKLTALGRLRQKANDATALGAYNLQQVRAFQSTKNQTVALNKLVGAGLSVADAYDAISDSSLAAAVASSKLKGKELREFVADTKAALAATKSFSAELGALQKIEERNNEIRAKTALQKTKFSFSEQQAILSDKELTDMFLSGNTGTNFKSRLAQILTPEFLQGLFEEGMNKALDAISIKERKIELDFEASTKSLTNLKDGVITLAQREISSIEYIIDDLDAELKDISDQEEKINEEYDKREKSLDKVRSLNDRIARQQKTQITIAQALSSGDIAAAARATQELRAQQAADAVEQQKENLTLARESKLASLRSKNGKSRAELEDKIKELENQIFKIQEERLEPAERTLELATDTRDIAISNVEYLGRNRDAWTSVALEIDTAKISSDNYGTSITAAIGLVEKLKTAWKNVGSESVAATSPISVPTGSGGSSPVTPSGPKELIPGDSLFNKMVDMYKKLSENAKQNFIKIVDIAPGSGFSNWIAKRKSGAISTKNLNYVIDSILKNGKVSNEEAVNKDGNVSFNKNLGGRIQGYSVGNIVPGIGSTDKVPGLLTPGEFVVRKAATKAYLPQLKAMNSGLFPRLNSPSYGLTSPNLSLAQKSANNSGQTMYNNTYSIDVNVSTDANPNEIARAVMTQIKQIDSQRIRGNRF